MAVKIVAGINDLNTINPDLASQWDWERNAPLTPLNTSAGSGKKVHWIGTCGHKWQATIASRNNGSGCPMCAKERIADNVHNAALSKNGNLLDRNPLLANEWAQDLNGNLYPEDFTTGSHKVVWWRGRCGHVWQTSIKNRSKGSSCPYCSSNKVELGFNDLVTINPVLASEWHPSRNTGFSPRNVTPGSSRIVWWKGKCGHEWLESVKARNNGKCCPVCLGEQVDQSQSLAFVYPDIAREWDYIKNGDVKPDDIAYGSHVKVWWLCENGHEWQASANYRTSKGRGCPYCCRNPKVLQGYNDLESLRPDVAEQWCSELNENLKPRDVTIHSNKKVWWVCPKGHLWKCAVNHRTNGSECPVCQRGYSTSFPEQAILYYIKKAYPDAQNGFTGIFTNHRMELDIYIPSLNLGIEYDGYAYHHTKTQLGRELKKYEICKKEHIKLIRIREDVLNADRKSSDVLLFTDGELDDTINQLIPFMPLMKELDIDVSRDQLKIKQAYLAEREGNSLLSKYPILAKEWNCDRNSGLTPAMFTPHSNQAVWWKCSKGHEWNAKIDTRVKGTGCPHCSNHKVLAGFNDLASKRPDLAAEWNYNKNNELKPSMVLPGSGKKVWWICHEGHEWEAEISSRNKGHGCPICARTRNPNK